MLASILALFSDPVWGPVLIGGLTLVAHQYFPVFSSILSKLPGTPATPAATPAGAPAAHPATPATPAPAASAHPVLDELRAVLPQLLLGAQKVLLANATPTLAAPSGGTVAVPLSPASPTASSPLMAGS